MTIDLAEALPALLPRAIAWAEAQSRSVLDCGAPLDAAARTLARSVGVANPERIRVRIVEAMPLPDDVELRAAALRAGLLAPGTLGLTLGYAVLVRRGHEKTTRLLSHEFRHVYQYERAGSIVAFLPVYLQEIVARGYADAPSEVDARAHEQIEFPQTIRVRADRATSKR
jgi:hypothetical protein